MKNQNKVRNMEDMLESSVDSDRQAHKVVQKKRKNSSHSKDKKRKSSKKSQEVNDVQLIEETPKTHKK